MNLPTTRIKTIQVSSDTPSHRVVTLEDARTFTVPLEYLSRTGLMEGQELPPGQVERLSHAADLGDALEAALRLLSYRPRSEGELRRRLSRDYPDAVVQQVMADMLDRGYLDDQAFAEAHVRDRVRLKPRGRRRLQQELRKKGVDRSVSEKAIDRVFREEGIREVDLALREAQRWERTTGRRYEDCSQWERRRRLTRTLLRRGFRGSALSKAVDTVVG